MPNYTLLADTATSVSADVISAFSTAVNQIVADYGSMIKAALPAALSIMGLGLVIALGIGFFKRVAH